MAADRMTPDDVDAYESIRRSPSGLFAGQFPDDVIWRLIRAGLIERYYEGAAALMGLSKVRATDGR